jgi:hypothetical protein
LIFLPSLTGFPYPSADALYSDLSISHYPNAVFLKRSLGEQGVIPLWSSTILSGYPFAANPLAGLLYPPGWLALIFPLPLGFNLLVMLHLLWGGAGMYVLLRAEGLAQPPSLLAALAFGTLPKLFAHYGAGHLSLLYAVPWTPWLLWSLHARGQRKFAGGWWWTSLILAFIFLADPRYAPLPQVAVAAGGRVFKAYGHLAFKSHGDVTFESITQLTTDKAVNAIGTN